VLCDTLGLNSGGTGDTTGGTDLDGCGFRLRMAFVVETKNECNLGIMGGIVTSRRSIIEVTYIAFQRSGFAGKIHATMRKFGPPTISSNSQRLATFSHFFFPVVRLSNSYS
jgi:hypothetical protein